VTLFVGVEEVLLCALDSAKMSRWCRRLQVLAVWESACVFGFPMRDCCKQPQVNPPLHMQNSSQQQSLFV
jgi:hypothetical protein